MVTKGYGFKVDDIDWSCPADLEPYAQAYQCEQKIADSLMWRMGLYAESAVATAVEHNLAGRKAKSQYVKKPFLQDAQIGEKKELSEERKAEMENQKLAMTLRVMQANYEISKTARGQ